MAAISERRLLFLDNMAAFSGRRLFLFFLDNMATILGFVLFRQYGSYFRPLSKKSYRRSKIAAILSKKSNRRFKIAAILSKKSNPFSGRRLFLFFLDNMATILGFVLFRQYGSYFRTTIVSALFRQYGNYFGFRSF
jgi:hypothetical protein